MKRAAAVLAAALVLALSITGLAATPANAETQSPIGRFGACLAGGGQGNVLMMFDKSGSLEDTDPNSGRLTAAKAVVEQFASTAEQRNTPLKLAVAGFDTGYEKSLDWTDMKQESVSGIQSHLDTYANKNSGLETDYWTALDGARKEFAAVKGQSSSCNLMLWFSDGGFAIAKRADDAQMQQWGGPKAWDPNNALRTDADVANAVKTAETDLCRDGGLADQFRSMGVISVGLGLAVDTGEESFDLMRNFVTGGGGCGKLTNPVPGQFVMSTDVDSLIYDFITVVDSGSEGSDENLPCVGQICEEGTRTFVLDDTIKSVAATAKTPVKGTKVYLKPRSGEAVELTADGGDQQIQGAKLTWKWVSDLVLTVNLSRGGQSDAWAGPWSIVFVAEETTEELAKSTISLKGDIAPALRNPDVELRAGAKDASLDVGIVDSEGKRIDPTTLSEKTNLDVSLVTPSGTKELATDLTGKAMEEPVKVSLSDVSPGKAELMLTLDVTTRDWTSGGQRVEGTRLEPQSASFPLTIGTPVDFPSVPGEIDFGATETDEPVSVDLPITGEGCVWLAGETTYTGFPSGQDNASLTSPADNRDNCASGKLTLTLDPAGLGNGSFTGTTKVMLAPANSSAEPAAVDVAFTLSQSRPASQPVLWGTLIGVTLLGVAIPLGILYLTKYLTAKIPGTAVLGASASGTVDQAGAFTDAGVPITPDMLRMTHLTNRREINVAGKTLRAKMGLALTEPGYVVVDTPGPSAGGRGTLQSVGGNAKLPLGVQGTWMVELDPERPASGPVLVTVFTAPGAAGMNDLFDDIRSGIRTAVEKLRQGLPPEAGPAAPNPWAGGGPAQPAADPWANPQPSAPSRDPWAGPPPAAQPRPPQPPQAPPPGNDPWTNPPAGNDPWANPPGRSGPSTW